MPREIKETLTEYWQKRSVAMNTKYPCGMRNGLSCKALSQKLFVTPSTSNQISSVASLDDIDIAAGFHMLSTDIGTPVTRDVETQTTLSFPVNTDRGSYKYGGWLFMEPKKQLQIWMLLLIVQFFQAAQCLPIKTGVVEDLSVLREFPLLESMWCDNPDETDSAHTTITCPVKNNKFYWKKSSCNYQCPVWEKLICMNTVNGTVFFCIPSNTSCSEGIGWQVDHVVNDKNGVKQVIINESTCPAGYYQSEPSECHNACYDKHDPTNLIPGVFKIFLKGNSSHPTILRCNHEEGYYNAGNKTLVNYVGMFSNDFCMHISSSNPCKHGQMPLYNQTCVDQCSPGYVRDNESFLCKLISVVAQPVTEVVFTEPQTVLISTEKPTTESVKETNGDSTINEAAIIGICSGLVVIALLIVIVCLVVKMRCQRNNVPTCKYNAANSSEPPEAHIIGNASHANSDETSSTLDDSSNNENTSQKTLFDDSSNNEKTSQKTLFDDSSNNEKTSQKTLFDDRSNNEKTSQKTLFDDSSNNENTSQKTLFDDRSNNENTSQKTLFDDRSNNENTSLLTQTDYNINDENTSVKKPLNAKSNNENAVLRKRSDDYSSDENTSVKRPTDDCSCNQITLCKKPFVGKTKEMNLSGTDDESEGNGGQNISIKKKTNWSKKIYNIKCDTVNFGQSFDDPSLLGLKQLQQYDNSEEPGIDQTYHLRD